MKKSYDNHKYVLNFGGLWDSPPKSIPVHQTLLIYLSVECFKYIYIYIYI